MSEKRISGHLLKSGLQLYLRELICVTPWRTPKWNPKETLDETLNYPKWNPKETLNETLSDILKKPKTTP